MGHGSAICARGIFEGFSLSLSADQIPSPEIPFFFPLLVELLSSAAGWKPPSLGSEVQLEKKGSALRLGETGKERTQTPQAFQTIVIPTGPQPRLTTLLVPPQSDCPSESSKNPPLSSQVRALDTRNLGLTSRQRNEAPCTPE